MTTTDAEVQALVGPQLRALAAVLEGRPDVAGEPSLCAGWTVAHVVAHMTMAARYDPPAFGAEIAAAGGDFERLSQTIADRDATLPFDRLLADLRSATMAAWVPPGGGSTGALVHAVVHALDVTAALGLPRTGSDEAMATVLDALTLRGVAAHFGSETQGRRFVAADLGWSAGDGAVVEAPAADLVLALTGRAAGASASSR